MTISEAAAQSGLTTHTLRYYEQLGLLPLVERTDSGIRIFKPADLDTLRTILELKAMDMPLAQIRDYIHCTLGGDDAYCKRLRLLKAHRESLLEQIEHLGASLDMAEHSIENTLCPCVPQRTA